MRGEDILFLRPIPILQALQPQIEIIRRFLIPANGPGNRESPELPEAEAAQETLGRESDLRFSRYAPGAGECDFEMARFEVEFGERVGTLGLVRSSGKLGRKREGWEMGEDIHSPEE